MGDKTITIHRLTRYPKAETGDELVFRTGVNVIVGQPNTGKTKWLRMLDYLMGDPDKPENAIGEDLVLKYDSIAAEISIAGRNYLVERKWREYGARTKVVVDGQPMLAGDFTRFLLTELGIPILHYPKGNPYSERAWPELSWRSLLRHIYRRQTLWGDIADRQPVSEQHACLMMFLGIAEAMYSDEHGEIVENRKKMLQLQGAKDQFTKILQEISHEIIEEEEIKVGLTSESIDMAVSRLRYEIHQLQENREEAVSVLVDETIAVQQPDTETSTRLEFEQLAEGFAQVQLDKEKIVARIKSTSQRQMEMHEYSSLLQDELARMARARSAGAVLTDLRITHCPACDQPVPSTVHSPNTCFLCKQTLSQSDDEQAPNDRRIDFEIEQLNGELDEIREMLAVLSSQQHEDELGKSRIDEEIGRIQGLLEPIRRVAAAILPPEIAVLDMEVGRLQERSRQLERMKSAFGIRTRLSDEIDELQHRISELEASAAKKDGRIDFERASDKLADGMNNYLNALRVNGESLWTQEPVSVRLGERSFAISVGDMKWSNKLGGTLILYFLLSYHHALLSISLDKKCHYPGLVILDLPASLEEGTTIVDKENYILEPFVDRVRRSHKGSMQVIATGAAFEGLAGAHRIELTHVWK